MGTHRSANACASCGKTVYPIEEIKALDQMYHKSCFKCQGEACELVLSLKSFTGVAGKVYCAKHVPIMKATQTMDRATLAATSAPKVQRVQGVKKNERMTFAPGELKAVNGEEEVAEQPSLDQH